MRDLVRQEVFDASETIVIKIGSNVLTRDDDQLDTNRIATLAAQISRLKSTGRHVVIVSSGAVAAGVGVLGMAKRPTSLPELQASASAGQMLLMRTWGEGLQQHGHRVAQILFTANDFRNRRRYLNVRNTIRTLLDFGLIPIVNENDSVSIREITLGDNDQVASMIAGLVPRPLTVILSAVAGLYDGNPSDANSRVLPLVEKPDEALQQHVAPEQSSRGRGGMAAKLSAILNITDTGENVILADGGNDRVLDQIATGQPVGTLFLASGSPVPAWKRWIGFTTQSEGQLNLDDGAANAVLKDGRSLLAVGITGVQGEFEQGAIVDLSGPTGDVIGRGLVNYSASDVKRVAGRRTEELAGLLGHVPYREVVHRDNLMILDARRPSE